MSLFKRTLGQPNQYGSPRGHFALGISLGLMIGLLPKDSLLPWAIGLIALLLPTNLGAAIIAVISTSFLGIALEPFAHRIGENVLGNEIILNWMTRLVELPGFGWTRLSNSVVMGLSMLSVVLAIPAYLVAHALYRDPRYSDFTADRDRLEDLKIARSPKLQES